MPDAASQPGSPLRGVLLVALAALTFAFADTVTKYLTMRYPVSVVVAVRYLVNLVLLIVLVGPKLGAGLWRTQRLSLVIVRGLCLAMASWALGFALSLMPIGETIAIVYLSPFLVMLLAMPLLGEKVSPLGWACATLGFLGVILIARPGVGLDPLGVVFALVSAAVSTAYHLLTRFLAGTETTIAMLFHTALVGSVIFTLLAIPSIGGITLTAYDFGMMALLGALMSFGHFLFTAAYREAPASMLAPVNYLHLAFAGGLGWLAFGHIPDGLTALGIVLVMAAGISIAGAARRRAPR